jgi:hypothetical protein
MIKLGPVQAVSVGPPPQAVLTSSRAEPCSARLIIA